jgi:hypothetical protein
VIRAKHLRLSLARTGKAFPTASAIVVRPQPYREVAKLTVLTYGDNAFTDSIGFLHPANLSIRDFA